MSGVHPVSRTGPGWGGLITIAVAYYVGARIGIATTVMPEGIVVLWPPNSILLAALLRYDGRGWLRLVPLVVVAEIVAGVPSFSVLEAFLFGVANVAEVSFAFVLLRWSGFDSGFRALEDLVRFTMAGPFAGALLGALIGATVYSVFRGGETGWFDFLLIWWFGDALGLAILTPVILRLWMHAHYTAVHAPARPFRARDRLIAVGGVVVLLLVVVFGRDQGVMLHFEAILVLPFVLHFCARFGTRHAALVVGSVAMVLILATTNGWGPFALGDPRLTVLRTQEFLLVMTLMGIGLAELSDRYRAQQVQLERVNQRLERRVAERTRALQRSNEVLEARVQERTERLRELNSRLRRYAMTDPLTDLPNRRAMGRALKTHIAKARREHEALLLLIIDIDELKAINDQHGHDAGDSAIRAFARALQRSVRTGDLVARTGGDEFVVIGFARQVDDAHPLAERILEAVRASQVKVHGASISLSASIGITLLDKRDRGGGRDMLRRADVALYAAKTNGRDQYVERKPEHPVGRTAASGKPATGVD